MALQSPSHIPNLVRLLRPRPLPLRTHLQVRCQTLLAAQTFTVPSISTATPQTTILATPNSAHTTCACAPTPEGLDIDYSKPMSMPSYFRHVVIRTGRYNWPSRIEDEDDYLVRRMDHTGKPRYNLARELKMLVGRGGKYWSADRNILITNCSLVNKGNLSNTNSVHVFPQGVFLPLIPNTTEGLEAFCEQFLVARKRLRLDASLPETVPFELGETIGGDQRKNSLFYKRMTVPMIQICAHNERDSRCGILGPLLHSEFVRLRRLRESGTGASSTPTSHVVSSSHLGGHSWAGNVIVSIPFRFLLEDGKKSPLEGKSIWYGRVEPKHVETILKETLGQGRIIHELSRGIHPSAPEAERRR